MKLLLLGATGATGRLVLRRALAEGHQVVAYVRNPDKLDLAHNQLFVHHGELEDLPALEQAMRGCSAVVSALGVTKSGPKPSDALPTILEAMRQNGIRRYVGISGTAVNAPGDRKPIASQMAGTLLRTFAPALVQDKQQELEVLRRTPDVDWTLARAGKLLDIAARKPVQVDPLRPHNSFVPRVAVAQFLVDQADSKRYSRQAVFVS